MTGEIWVPMVQANAISVRAKAMYLADHPVAEGAWISASIPFEPPR